MIHTNPQTNTDAPSLNGLVRVWLADLTYTQQTIAADVIPNAIGGICTYTEKHFGLGEPMRLFKYPEALTRALRENSPPEVIGFSNYVWNFELSYGIARIIKQQSPRTVIVFGGPNYPTTKTGQRAFLQAHPAIDFYVIKEGEIAFLQLLRALVAHGMDTAAVRKIPIASIHCLAADGSAQLREHVDRITDLSEIPSPYTTGRLDEFFDGRLLPIIQTNRGCPFGCTFCVEGVGYYNKVRRGTQDKIDAELAYIGAKMMDLRQAGGRNDLFIADSNFGMYREDLDTARTLANTRSRYGWPEYINVATGKNQKERVLEASRIIDGALRLSGSVQSLDETVLENIKRKNIDAQGLFELGLKAEEIGANTYSEVILALPGDSYKAHMSTVKTVMNAGFTNIFLFQLMLLPGTEMATEESRDKFGMTTRFRVLPRCYGHYKVLGQDLVAAEIEEICVANSTLSFDDYLRARLFHLIVTIFHNDGVFAAPLKFLRAAGIPVFRWMELLMEIAPPPGLRGLYDDFMTATREELWDDRASLEAFIQREGNVEKFIAGELGNNLLFVHKTLGITRHLDELASHARVTLRRCLAEQQRDTEDVLSFIDDSLIYHCARARDLFDNTAQPPLVNLRFDFDAYLAANRQSRHDEFRLPNAKAFRFLMDDSQKALINRYVGIYGDSPVSIGRILSKVHVKRLFRHAVQEGDANLSAAGLHSETSFLLTGLQQ